jgi:calcineurin-like phosphoesterase family protein
MLRAPLLSVVALAGLHLGACDRPKVQEVASQRSAAAAQAAPAATATLSARLSRPAPARLVAIGDLHGDLDHARRAFRLAGAIDDRDRWVGGPLVVVQTGDEIDRGDDDKAILDLVEGLKKQAVAAGGELIALLGNHEVMNASLDFRYVTAGSFATFSPFEAADASASRAGVGPEARGRAAAFAPGGSYASIEASRPFVVKVGDTVFVHGGILPKHVAYGLDRMNDELDGWLAGRRRDVPAVLVAEDGPVWTRAYSSEDAPPDCTDLTTALAELGAKRMVVGHTVQHHGANSACEGQVWRIDVGMSRYFGGPIEVLEIRGNDVAVLREAAPK